MWTHTEERAFVEVQASREEVSGLLWSKKPSLLQGKGRAVSEHLASQAVKEAVTETHFSLTAARVLIKNSKIGEWRGS